MFTDATLKPIHDGQQYVAPNGTQFPRDFPKNEIPGLRPVILTERPAEVSVVVTGFIINEQLTQVWQTRPKTQAEQNIDALEKRKSALAAKWRDAFDLLDDILNRGLVVVKEDRDAIKTANPKP